MIVPIFVILPLFAAFINTIIGKFSKIFADIFVNLINFILMILSFVSLYNLNSSEIKTLVYLVGGWKIPFGIAMIMDYYTVFMLLTVNIIAFFVSLYSISYIERYTEKWGFYSLFELMLAGMNGVIISGDIFNIFVFLEIASIASYALVAFGTEKEELEAAFKYIVFGSISTGLILLGIIFIYGYTSTLNLADIANTVKDSNDYIVRFISFIFIIGFAIKAAIVPFHSWLPDAHPSAPAPISSMLSGVLIKTLGIYLITRFLFNVFPLDNKMLNIIAYLGMLSMVVGVVLALYQWDYKRLLAYHSISQVGYILLGIGLGTPLGILGGLFHLMNHSIFKSLLFLTSGSLEYSFGTRDLKRLSSFESPVSVRMPTTTFSAYIGSLSIAGIPPFNGFWSKLIIVIACVQTQNLLGAFVAIVVSVLTLASFLKVLKYGFYLSSEKNGLIIKDNTKKEVPIFMRISMISLAILCITMGFLLYPEIKQIFLQNVVEVLHKGINYAELILK